MKKALKKIKKDGRPSWDEYFLQIACNIRLEILPDIAAGR